MPKIVDLTGRKFGILTVLNFYSFDKRGKNKLWLCQCACGNQSKSRTDSLLNGATQSCGCQKEIRRLQVIRIHGMTKTGAHRSYMNARSRCNNPRNKRYQEYGGRGIEFRFDSFEQFFSELGPRPEGKTLDRPNSYGHYEPGNVRWATLSEQNRNRRPFKKKEKKIA